MCLLWFVDRKLICYYFGLGHTGRISSKQTMVNKYGIKLPILKIWKIKVMTIIQTILKVEVLNFPWK